jgi:hypothetical protein
LTVSKRAESPISNSAGQRPAKKDTRKREALKGRNPLLSTAAALSGLVPGGPRSFHRALPCAIDCKAFSLNLTAMGRGLRMNIYILIRYILFISYPLANKTIYWKK